MQYIVLVDSHGGVPFGPFASRAEAQRFADFMSTEVDPAAVRKLRSPVLELLNWRDHLPPVIKPGPPECADEIEEPEELKLYSVTRVAEILSCSDMHIYRQIAAGELRAVDISTPGAGRPKTRIRSDDLADYIGRKVRLQDVDA